MVIENSAAVSGLLHFIESKKGHKYFPFAIRHENPWTDGTIRKDFLVARAFSDELQAQVRGMEKGTPIRVGGVLRSSRGSGDLYLAVQTLARAPEAPAGSLPNLENAVRISGLVHLIKGQSEGVTGTGKYVQFAVRQDNQELDGSPRRDFLVVRVYDPALREALASMKDGDPVTVEGTLRSSRGSGVNYIRCGAMS